MAGAAGVKAGEAYVELGLRDRYSQALEDAKAKFEAFAKKMAIVGGGLTAAGGSLVAGIGNGLREFMSLGSALQDVSERSGASAEALSALRFAADQAGVSLEGVEAALRGVAKFQYQLAKGNKAALGVAGMLGIDPQSFLGASTIGKLALIADGLATIQDESMRAALAMKVMGKGGAVMAPVLAGGSAKLREMVAEAQRLGIVLSAEDVAKADELGDRLGAVGKQVEAAWFAIGAAIAEPALAVVNFLQDAFAATIQFIRANQTLVIVAAAVGGSLMAAGAACLALSAAGYIAAGAMTALGVALTVVEFLLTPIGLITAAVVGLTAVLAGGVAAWLAFTDSGHAAIAGLWAFVKPMVDLIKTTVGGIFDAAMAGQWELAWQIGGAAISVVWKGIVAGLATVWQGFVGFFQDGWTKFKGLVAGAMISMVYTFGKALADVQAMFVGFANKIAELLGSSIRFDGIDALREFGKNAAKNKAAAQQGLREDTERELKANAKSRADKLQPYNDAVKEAQGKLDALRQKAADARQAEADKLKVEVPELRAASRNLQQGGLGAPAGGGVLGTFSGAIAGLLGRSAPDIQKDIERNTARTADLLEEIADGDGLAFE